MFVLVTGGAASGKSAYAENLLLRSPASPKCYLATMLAQDAESRARVERHRAMRKGKGISDAGMPFCFGDACCSKEFRSIVGMPVQPLGK